jgi:PAS domain-containing protein
MGTDIVFPLVLVAASDLSVVAALLIAAAVDRRVAGRDRAGRDEGDAVFLLGDRVVLDANERGFALLGTLAAQPLAAAGGPLTGPAASWQRLTRHLAERFPGVMSRLAEGNAAAWQIVSDTDANQRLEAVPANGALRLILRDGAAGEDGEAAVRVDALSWRALNDELEALRRATDSSPVPAWRETAEGRIVWANGAYLRLVAEGAPSDPLGWPLPALFPADRVGSIRQSVPGAGGRLRWFDLSVVEDGAGRLVFAVPADEAHKADRARRDFVETLSRTFATLPIGLAVFDRARRLQLFNPALIDLTGLEPEFLAARPGLEGVLNRMREKHVMPEPRDYRAWTRRLLDVEAVATGAGFEEVWALPDGRSYRVSAAPHPDGALAFLIEDVTSDIRARRNFRAELDTGRAALDLVDEAVAVFAATGELVLTNRAFDRMWTLEGADSLAGVQFREAVANWRQAGGTTDLWDRIAALAAPGSGASPAVRGTLTLEDGEAFNVHASPAPGGGVMIGFSAQPAPRAPRIPAAGPVLRRASA